MLSHLKIVWDYLEIFYNMGGGSPQFPKSCWVLLAGELTDGLTNKRAKVFLEVVALPIYSESWSSWEGWVIHAWTGRVSTIAVPWNPVLRCFSASIRVFDITDFAVSLEGPEKCRKSRRVQKSTVVCTFLLIFHHFWCDVIGRIADIHFYDTTCEEMVKVSVKRILVVYK